jgi:hypothetical protein
MIKLLAFDAWLHWPLVPQFSHLVEQGDKIVREKWEVTIDAMELVNNYITLEWNNSSTLYVGPRLLFFSQSCHRCVCRCSGTCASLTLAQRSCTMTSC